MSVPLEANRVCAPYRLRREMSRLHHFGTLRTPADTSSKLSEGPGGLFLLDYGCGHRCDPCRIRRTTICPSRIFIDGEKRGWRKREPSSAMDPTKAPEMRESLERADAFHHRLCDPLSGLGAVLGDVIADPFHSGETDSGADQRRDRRACSPKIKIGSWRTPRPFY